MSKETFPVVHLAHFMLKRDGQRCTCLEKQTDPASVCGWCWGTTFVGGYTLRQGSVSYEMRDENCAEAQGGTTWTYRQYQLLDLHEHHIIDSTPYAVGDFLLDFATGDRWRILGFDGFKVHTRKIMQYEAATAFPAFRAMEVAKRV